MKPEQVRPKIEFHAKRGDTPQEAEMLGKLGANSPIVLARDYLPEWFKNLDATSGKGRTARECAGIFDYVRTGYIMPMWCDMVFKVDTDNPMRYEYKLPNIYNGFEHLIVEHDYSQAKDAPFLDYGCQTIIKLVSPFYIQVPEGVSIYYTVPFYSVNQEDFTICAGVCDPEVKKVANREMNIFIKLNKRGENIFLKKGQPLVQIIPFIRSDYDFEVFVPEVSEFDALRMESRSTIDLYEIHDDDSIDRTKKNLKVHRMPDG